MKGGLDDEIPSKYINLWYRENEHDYRVLTITDGLVKLNTLAAYIWNLIDGKRSVGEIRNAVTEQYRSVEPERIAVDVETIINRLVELEVITLSWRKFGEESR